jgi:hypothetical protein
MPKRFSSKRMLWKNIIKVKYERNSEWQGQLEVGQLRKVGREPPSSMQSNIGAYLVLVSVDLVSLDFVSFDLVSFDLVSLDLVSLVLLSVAVLVSLDVVPGVSVAAIAADAKKKEAINTPRKRFIKNPPLICRTVNL